MLCWRTDTVAWHLKLQTITFPVKTHRGKLPKSVTNKQIILICVTVASHLKRSFWSSFVREQLLCFCTCWTLNYNTSNNSGCILKKKGVLLHPGRQLMHCFFIYCLMIEVILSFSYSVFRLLKLYLLWQTLFFVNIILVAVSLLLSCLSVVSIFLRLAMFLGS